MKHFQIKRSKQRRTVFIADMRPYLSKPKIPLVVFWNVHKSENIYIGWN